jgi:putative ubiquitin-RnfH superfamily antitoxin RatB of RatAB toxin-antitoxin module
MQISVAYSTPANQIWLRIEVPEESTVEQAIIKSGILRQFPDIDLTAQKVGIFGKLAQLDAMLRPGDRIEIYRPITADPATTPRRRTNDEDDDD